MTGNDNIHPKGEQAKPAEAVPSPYAAQPSSAPPPGSAPESAGPPLGSTSVGPAGSAGNAGSPPTYTPGSVSVPPAYVPGSTSASPPYPPPAPPPEFLPPASPDPATVPLPSLGASPGAPAKTGSRLGVAIAIAVAAIVLALGSGGTGAAVALLLDRPEPAVTKTYTAAPVVDRSSLADIAASLRPSVVSINVGSAAGSGVILTADGYILTNNHVLASARGATATVTFSDGKRARARIVGTDARTDLGVIKADGVSGLTPAKFGDSDAMRVGDTVLALGSPLGLDGSVTAGIISAKDRTITEGGGSPFNPTPVTSISGLLQTDAAINPGNSGGPLANLNGEVVGINTAIATSGGGNGNIGVGFAIPSNRAKQVADQLIKGMKVSHPALGVQVSTPDGGGALIGSVVPNSAAASAGLQEGDLITKVGDRTINSSDDLVSVIQSHKVGDQLEITYVRDGVTRTTTVTLLEAS